MTHCLVLFGSQPSKCSSSHSHPLLKIQTSRTFTQNHNLCSHNYSMPRFKHDLKIARKIVKMTNSTNLSLFLLKPSVQSAETDKWSFGLIFLGWLFHTCKPVSITSCRHTDTPSCVYMLCVCVFYGRFHSKIMWHYLSVIWIQILHISVNEAKPVAQLGPGLMCNIHLTPNIKMFWSPHCPHSNYSACNLVQLETRSDVWGWIALCTNHTLCL